MNTLKTTLLIAVLASSAMAGPVYDKTPQAPVTPPLIGCECFAPGLAVGVFGGGFLPDSDADDELGGGVLLEYFFNEYIGLQGSYGVYTTESEHHQFDGSLVLRYPIKSICLAPYVLAGGGASTNSETSGDWHVGGGIEARIESANCLGIFADGVFHFAEDEVDDYTIVRVGVKFRF